MVAHRLLSTSRPQSAAVLRRHSIASLLACEFPCFSTFMREAFFRRIQRTGGSSQAQDSVLFGETVSPSVRYVCLVPLKTYYN